MVNDWTDGGRESNVLDHGWLMFSRTFSGKPKTYIMDVIGTCLYSDGSTMLITIERLKALVRVQTRLVALSRRTHLVLSQQDRQVGTFFSPKKCLAWH